MTDRETTRELLVRYLTQRGELGQREWFLEESTAAEVLERLRTADIETVSPAQGAGPAEPAMLPPADGELSWRNGYAAFNRAENHMYHSGLDLDGTRGVTVIRATGDGTIVEVFGLAPQGGGPTAACATGNERIARALDGISYDVRKGETICLVGESGCGKTVSALTILGIIPRPPGKIMGGKVLFNGQNLLDLGEEEMQKIRGNQIAMVFQEPMTSLNPVFTVEDQIQEAIMVHERVDEKGIRQRCIQHLKDVGIP